MTELIYQGMEAKKTPNTPCKLFTNDMFAFGTDKVGIVVYLL